MSARPAFQREDTSYMDNADKSSGNSEKDAVAVFTTVTEAGEANEPSTHLKRGLNARHVSLMTFSGVIGTGIFLSTGAALTRGGPLGLLLAFMIYSGIMWQVSQCAGEMATYLPVEGGFLMWASRFVNRQFGAATHYNYYYTTLTIAMAEISACNSALAMWAPDVNPAVWVSVFLVFYITANSLPSKHYGEVEFWASIFKIGLVLVLIATSFIFMVGGNPEHEAFGFRYWKNPGPMAEYIDTGATGRLLGFWSCMASAAFTIGGPDYIAITASEMINPRRMIPKQVKRTAVRLCVLYWLSIIFMGVLVPYNSPELADALANGNGMGRSIFVVGLEKWGIGKGFRHFANAMLITSAGSCGNSLYYCSVRCMHSMSHNGYAPKVFKRTSKRGVPYYSVALSGAICCVTYLCASSSASKGLDWFISLSTLGLIINFTSMLVSWHGFQKALKAQGFGRDALPFKGANMRFGPYVAIVLMVVIMLTSAFSVFTNGNWDVQSFICGYFGLAFYAFCYVMYWVIARPPKQPAGEVDLLSGKGEVDADEQWHLENTVPPKNALAKFLDWLF